MGKYTFSREAYRGATKEFVPEEGPATFRAEQEAHSTGKLHPLVDPAGYGLIRRSLPRFEKQDNGLWLLTVGTPIPEETRLDTTGSMGGNVDIAIRVLSDAYELEAMVLPGYDLQMATGIFGDIVDRFVLCRPQFEMTAEKIVEQLTLMVPERDGGDWPEDPHYGIFGATYLTDAYISKIGLKGYDFTVTDAPARDLLDIRQLIRIFGEDVFKIVLENGFQINPKELPTTAEVVQDLLKRAHAFVLIVGNDERAIKFWTGIYGKERVVILPSTELLPHVKAIIIGLTEGALKLGQVEEFLQKNNINKTDAKRIARSVANIPIGAQAALSNFGKRPQKGDLFKKKTDIWPINKEEIAERLSSEAKSESEGDDLEEGPEWL